MTQEEIKQILESTEIKELISEEIENNFEKFLAITLTEKELQDIGIKFIQRFNQLTEDSLTKETCIQEILKLKEEIKIMKKVLYQLLMIRTFATSEEKRLMEALRKQYPQLETGIIFT